MKNIILLSGGSGKRLWPLSNDIRSKQFLKLFKHNGTYESMVQRIYRQIKSVNKSANITIATSQNQVSSIKNQLGDNVSISVEPCRRDTFPAIALAVTYLHSKGVDENEPVVVCPVDSFVDDCYFSILEKMYDVVRKDYNLALLGLAPTEPSEKFGYIIPKTNDEVSEVSEFKEKPNAKLAEEYISQGALWNGGVFAFKLKYVLDICKKIFGTDDYHELFNSYENLEKISFDYAVVEKEKRIAVLRYSGSWKDLGTWDSLVDSMDDNVIGDVKVAQSKNVYAINELDVPILAIGLNDVVISASPDGILISDKASSSDLKKYIDDRDAKFAEKSWGDFRVIDLEENSITIKVNIKAGDHMNYHSHQFRDEVWVIVDGKGRTIVDGMEQKVGPGDVITMKRGCRHTIYADSDLTIVEVQLGKEIKVDDKQKYPLEK